MADSFLTAIDVIAFDDEIVLTLTELCRANGTDKTQVFALVGEGVLAPIGIGPEDWIFDGASLQTARMALRLARDFELGVPGVAIVLELLARIKGLQIRLNRAGVQ